MQMLLQPAALAVRYCCHRLLLLLPHHHPQLLLLLLLLEQVLVLVVEHYPCWCQHYLDAVELVGADVQP